MRSASNSFTTSSAVQPPLNTPPLHRSSAASSMTTSPNPPSSLPPPLSPKASMLRLEREKHQLTKGVETFLVSADDVAQSVFCCPLNSYFGADDKKISDAVDGISELQARNALKGLLAATVEMAESVGQLTTGAQAPPPNARKLSLALESLPLFTQHSIARRLSKTNPALDSWLIGKIGQGAGDSVTRDARPRATSKDESTTESSSHPATVFSGHSGSVSMARETATTTSSHRASLSLSGHPSSGPHAGSSSTTSTSYGGTSLASEAALSTCMTTRSAFVDHQMELGVVSELPKINQYSLLDRLGTGSQGTVYLAFDEKKEEFRAVKEVKKPLATSAEMAQLKTEIDIMKRLRHRNIVSLYEVINDPTQRALYLVMQYVENGPLVHFEDKEKTTCLPLDPYAFIDMAKQLVSGLKYLHSLGIYHRDIKPDNVLVGDAGRVYLADFGVAHRIDEVTAMVHGSRRNSLSNSPSGSIRPTPTESPLEREPFGNLGGGFKGTPAFFPPEMLREATFSDVARAPDSTGLAAADVWALGVTFYLVLVGRLPFGKPLELADAPPHVLTSPRRVDTIHSLNQHARGKPSSPTQSALNILELSRPPQLPDIPEAPESQQMGGIPTSPILRGKEWDGYTASVFSDTIAFPNTIPQQWQELITLMLEKNLERRITIRGVRECLKAMNPLAMSATADGALRGDGEEELASITNEPPSRTKTAAGLNGAAGYSRSNGMSTVVNNGHCYGNGTVSASSSSGSHPLPSHSGLEEEEDEKHGGEEEAPSLEGSSSPFVKGLRLEVRQNQQQQDQQAATTELDGNYPVRSSSVLTVDSDGSSDDDE